MDSATLVDRDYEDAPPPYNKVDDNATSSAAPRPSSPASQFNFTPTSQLQIEAIGYDVNQALTGKTLENIAVYRADTGALGYTSLRLKRSSNSCALVRGSDRVPLIATVYRWGPGRPPKMRILPHDTPLSVEEAINLDSADVQCEVVDVRSASIFTHTQKFDTSFGAFVWRYGSKSERKEAYGATSLLVMERTDVNASVSGKGAIRVAHLVRNDQFRTAGTTKDMGGNGGRLMLDLRAWAENKKASIGDIEAFVVASCICMLKREGDRYQDNTIAAVV